MSDTEDLKQKLSDVLRQLAEVEAGSQEVFAARAEVDYEELRVRDAEIEHLQVELEQMRGQRRQAFEAATEAQREAQKRDAILEELRDLSNRLKKEPLNFHVAADMVLARAVVPAPPRAGDRES